MARVTRETLMQTLREHGIRSPSVLEAIGAVPREAFVLPGDLEFAYEDRPLPIGHDQTISQPWMVAHMTEWARIQPGDRVLEIGTGCGYQTAILSKLAKQVFTVERIATLQDSTRQRLESLGLTNIEFRVGDGFDGWPDRGPFDVILVTAAPETIPAALEAQLAEGGRLVIPVGPRPAGQRLWKVTRTGKTFSREVGVRVKFVPLIPGEPKTTTSHN